MVCMKSKIRDQHGFTLAETLLAVIILLLASTIVASGIPAARNAYEKVVLASDAEVLLSTTISTLRNELGMAEIISVNNNSIVYFNKARGANAKIYLGSSEPKAIMLARYYKEGDADTNEALISDPASTDNMYVTFSQIVRGDGYLTFKNLQVNRKNGGTGLAGPRDYSVRVSSS